MNRTMRKLKKKVKQHLAKKLGVEITCLKIQTSTLRDSLINCDGFAKSVANYLNDNCFSSINDEKIRY